MTDVNANVRDKSTRSHRLKVENDTKNRPCELDISKELFLSFMPVLSNGFSFLAARQNHQRLFIVIFQIQPQATLKS